MIKEKNFTEGAIFAPLVRFAFPVLLALVLQTMYGAVDLLIVGQFGTAADVSAVATGTMLMQSMTSIVIGIAMGTTILLGRWIGEGRSREAGKIVEASVWLFSAVALILTVAVIIFAEGICKLMQAPEEAFASTVSYVRICSAGFIFIVAYNVLSSILRGIGNSKMPLVTVAIASVFNIGGDLLLVGAFGLAGNGAAIATVAAQAISVLVSVLIIKKFGLPFSFKMRGIKNYKSEMLSILKLGTPIALQDFLVSVSFLVIMAIVNSLGVVVSAGVGVAEKLCGFIMLVPSSFMQTLSTIVAQNIGAKKFARARKALIYGIISSLAVGLVMSWASFFHGDVMSRLFTADPAVIAASAEYLKAYAIDTLLVSFLFSFIGYFNGMGKTTFVMLQGIIGAFGVRIPVAYIMSHLPEVSIFKVALATPCSTVVQIILCSVLFFVLEAKRRKSEDGLSKFA